MGFGGGGHQSQSSSVAPRQVATLGHQEQAGIVKQIQDFQTDDRGFWGMIVMIWFGQTPMLEEIGEINDADT